MTHQAPPAPGSPGSDPGHQVAQLREALRLVATIAGRPDSDSDEARLDEAARISAAYDRALPVAQRRFDARAAETALWAAAGVEALLADPDAPPPRAAAGRLATAIERALSLLGAALEAPVPRANRAS